MKSLVLSLAFVVLICSIPLNTFAQEIRSESALNREQLAKSDAVKYKNLIRKVAAIDPANLTVALGLDPATVSLSFAGNDAQVAVSPALGVLVPTQGNTFVLLSTGVAGAGTGGLASPQPGTSFGAGSSTGYDLAQITLGPMTVPTNQKSIMIDFFFLSAEYPEYVGSQFNDFFRIEIYGSSKIPDGTNLAKDGLGHDISINSVSFALNENNVQGSGFQGVGGGTGLLTATAEVSPGDNITLKISIADIGDNIYDSEVMLDNVRFSSTGGSNASIICTPKSFGILQGETREMTVSLTSPAPQNGLNINVSSSNVSVATVTPSTIQVPGGGNQATQKVSIIAHANGEATISAAAGGYDAGTAVVRVGTDLFVSNSDVTIVPSGQSYDVHAVVHNQGTDVSNVEVKFIEENQDNNTQKQLGPIETIPSLGANDQKELVRSFTPSSGNVLIYVRLDPSNKVSESNEQNNTASKALVLQKPSVLTVKGKYNAEKDPNIIGRFVSGLKLPFPKMYNTIFATTSGNVSRVVFELNGITIEDNDPSDGWSAVFDMAALPSGYIPLKVTAYAPNGVPSVPVTKLVHVGNWPDWLPISLISNVVEASIDDKWITVKLKCKIPNSLIPGSQQEGPFEFIVSVNGQVKFLPADRTYSLSTKLELIVGFPIDPAVGMKGGLGLQVQQKVFGKEISKQELQGVVFFNADDSFNSGGLFYEVESKLFGYTTPKIAYPLFPGVSAVIGGGFDLLGKMRMNVVFVVNDGKLAFGVTPDGKVTKFEPGLGFKFNLIAGLEIAYGLIGGELILSPEFDMYVGCTYVQPPLGNGAALTVSGEGKVTWKVVGTVFFGVWESELAKGVFGPWPMFSASTGSLANKLDKVNYSDAVQLPSVLPLPTIAADTLGNVMVVWLEKPDVNGPPQIFYSVKTSQGTFSIPHAVIENQFYKSDPRITFCSDGSATAVFTQNSLDASYAQQNLSLAEIIRYQDIYYSTWNKNAWSTPVLLTHETPGNERSDGMPTLAVSPNGQHRLIMWTRNTNANSLDRSKLEIYSLSINSGVIGTPSALTDNLSADLMVRNCFTDDSTAVAVWVNDADADAATLNDFQIFYSAMVNEQWAAPQRLTNDNRQEKDPSLCPLRDGRALGAWVEVETLPDSSINYHLLTSVFDGKTISWSTPVEVSQSDHFIETPIVQVDNRNIATITWRGYYESMNGDLLISLRDFRDPVGVWTSPRPLTDDDFIDWMCATTIDAQNNQYFVNLKTATTGTLNASLQNKPNFFGGLNMVTKGIKASGQLGDGLNIGSYYLAPDLMVDSTSVTFDSTATSGVPTSLRLKVYNVGGTVAEGSVLRVLNKPVDQGGTTIVPDIVIPKILPGGHFETILSFTPVDSGSICLVADAANTTQEQSKQNNVFTRQYSFAPDVSVANMSTLFDGVPAIGHKATGAAVIENKGKSVAKNVKIEILETDKDTLYAATTVLDTTITEIDIDSTKSIEFSHVASKYGRTFLWVLVDPHAQLPDENRSNNSLRTYFDVLPDLRVDSIWYDAGTKKIGCLMRNVGGYRADGFSVHLFEGNPLIGGIVKDSITVVSLESQSVDTLRFSYKKSGSATMYVWIDKDSKINELSKENNVAYGTIVSPGSVDLISEIMPLSSSTDTSANIKFAVRIKNVGTQGSNSIPYNIVLQNVGSGQDSLLKISTVPILNPAEEYTDTVTSTLKSDNLLRIHTVVDPENSIIESNKTNNDDSLYAFGKKIESKWNLLSWNLDTKTDSAAVLLAPIKEKLRVALGFENGGLAFDPSIPPANNTLTIMDHTHGYWFKMNESSILPLYGYPADIQTPICLTSGWNLVSYLPSQPDSIGNALLSILNNTEVVLGYEEGGLAYVSSIPKHFNTLRILKPGHGYWIKVSNSDTLVYPSKAAGGVGSSPASQTVKLNKTTALAVSPTQEWINVFGEDARIGGQKLPVGTRINAVYRDTIVCGECVVTEEGKFGLMAIYRDDPLTKKIEGPAPNDFVKIKAGNFTFPQAIRWTSFGETIDFGKVLGHAGRDGFLIPERYELYQNYPNPFNPSTTLRYDLPKHSRVTLRIYNLLGSDVVTLANGEQDAGVHILQWDGLSIQRVPVSSGVYFCRLTTESFSKVIKMLVIR